MGVPVPRLGPSGGSRLKYTINRKVLYALIQSCRSFKLKHPPPVLFPVPSIILTDKYFKDGLVVRHRGPLNIKRNFLEGFHIYLENPRVGSLPRPQSHLPPHQVACNKVRIQ